MGRQIVPHRGGHECGHCSISDHCLARAQKKDRCKTEEERRIRSHVGLVRHDIVAKLWIGVFATAALVYAGIFFSGVLWPVS